MTTECNGCELDFQGLGERTGARNEWHYRLSRLYLRRRPDVERSGGDGRDDRERRLM